MSEALFQQSPQETVHTLGMQAKEASRILVQTSESNINAILNALAVKLRDNVPILLEGNAKDLAAGEQKGLSPALLDRLALNEERIEGMAAGVETVANLPDPVNRVLWETERPNGLKIQRVVVPIGVLGMIYESRPNVAIDAAALCLKSRNAVILRGGSESLHSSLALHRLIQETLKEHRLPEGAVGMIPVPDRAAVDAMLAADQYIDVMIPRGGKGLIERVQNHARMPVFSHLDGICHVYIHKDADPQIAVEVTRNSKLRRTGLCNAAETLLLDQKLDPEIAKAVLSKLLDEGCEIVGDKMAQALDSRIGVASAHDWGMEYLDKKISCAVVGGIEEAVNHINTYGSHHTDSILTQDEETAAYFFKNVDSGSVMHNTSTQFADGGEYGFGAEIGIATGKMHARGPVGLEQLCTYKYLVHGTGQTRP
ncbi:MAG TPA: glutamate-5-semialdehyde dehydrogenase [Alphaproteobacteria bacterium]|nr:glutamate-5-semialdehyde dehydrogenase [Alphaproteobacteria bacterium]USO06243.1 MAG: glutamate-5-semialdehyde dehydrogenase [Rhodospirillales bacterium]HOO82453.1 glutamate-5-semialdehyde dehydrogenase [Alphaproteobacteria bacterium]